MVNRDVHEGLGHGRELPRSPQRLSLLSPREYAERLSSVKGLSEEELEALAELQRHAARRPFSHSLHAVVRDLIGEWYQ